MAKIVRAEGIPSYEGPWWALAKPQIVLGVHGSVVLMLCFVAASRATARAAVRLWWLPVGILVGGLAWTLFEYILHRWLLHHTRRPLVRRVFWDAVHREHHAYPVMEDPDHHSVHPAITLPIAGLLALVVSDFTTGTVPPALLAGYLLGYCAYEALHWLFHANRPLPWLIAVPTLARLQEAHEVHHLRNASRNYGFLTMFWDRRFGTDA